MGVKEAVRSRDEVPYCLSKCKVEVRIRNIFRMFEQVNIRMPARPSVNNYD